MLHVCLALRLPARASANGAHQPNPVLLAVTACSETSKRMERTAEHGVMGADRSVRTRIVVIIRALQTVETSVSDD